MYQVAYWGDSQKETVLTLIYPSSIGSRSWSCPLCDKSLFSTTKEILWHVTEVHGRLFLIKCAKWETVSEKPQLSGCHLRYCTSKVKQNYLTNVQNAPFRVNHSPGCKSIARKSIMSHTEYCFQRRRTSLPENKNFKYTDEELAWIAWCVCKLKDKRAKNINAILGEEIGNRTEVAIQGARKLTRYKSTKWVVIKEIEEERKREVTTLTEMNKQQQQDER